MPALCTAHRLQIPSSRPLGYTVILTSALDSCFAVGSVFVLFGVFLLPSDHVQYECHNHKYGKETSWFLCLCVFFVCSWQARAREQKLENQVLDRLDVLLKRCFKDPGSAKGISDWLCTEGLGGHAKKGLARALW